MPRWVPRFYGGQRREFMAGASEGFSFEIARLDTYLDSSKTETKWQFALTRSQTHWWSFWYIFGVFECNMSPLQLRSRIATLSRASEAVTAAPPLLASRLELRRRDIHIQQDLFMFDSFVVSLSAKICR